jgi:Mn-dependent DtxR family transcriptional regulator
MQTHQEHQILALLAKEWRMKGPPGIVEISTIIAAVDLAPSEASEAIASLFRTGLIDMNRFKTSAFLTPEGYDAAASVVER